MPEILMSRGSLADATMPISATRGIVGSCAHSMAGDNSNSVAQAFSLIPQQLGTMLRYFASGFVGFGAYQLMKNGLSVPDLTPNQMWLMPAAAFVFGALTYSIIKNTIVCLIHFLLIKTCFKQQLNDLGKDLNHRARMRAIISPAWTRVYG